MARTSKKSPNTARQRRQATMPPSPLAQQSQQQLENIRTALAHDQTELAVTLLATLQQQDPRISYPIIRKSMSVWRVCTHS